MENEPVADLQNADCVVVMMHGIGDHTARHILKTARSEFEALLLEIAEYAEEWLTSAQAMGHASRPASARVLPWDQTSPRPVRANGRANGRMPVGVAAVRAPARMPVTGDGLD